jgi:hypothetical protein
MFGNTISIELTPDEQVRLRNRIEGLHSFAFYSENNTIKVTVEQIIDLLSMQEWEAPCTDKVVEGAEQKDQNSSEKYYICPSCGDLVTQTKINEFIDSGGMGLCYCGYIKDQWDSRIQDFGPIHFRNYPDYVEISERIYSALKQQSNTVLRLEMFNTIPRGDLI